MRRGRPQASWFRMRDSGMAGLASERAFAITYYIRPLLTIYGHYIHIRPMHILLSRRRRNLKLLDAER